MTESQPAPDDEDREQSGHATGLADQEGRSGIDTSPVSWVIQTSPSVATAMPAIGYLR